MPAKIIKATLKDGRRVTAFRDRVYLSTVAGWSGLGGSHMADGWVIVNEEDGQFAELPTVQNNATSDHVRFPNAASVISYLSIVGAEIEGGLKVKDCLSFTNDGEIIYSGSDKSAQLFFHLKRVRPSQKFPSQWNCCELVNKDGRYQWIAIARGKTKAEAAQAAFEKFNNNGEVES